ncbi:MtrAB system histidine kinase MtrB [Rarobacter incanus]|uniref:MtrAB system histidine kinase MtrB n=1 Tax=Rarobacter incanus TaxID=153494 RepID=UPI0014776F38
MVARTDHPDSWASRMAVRIAAALGERWRSSLQTKVVASVVVMTILSLAVLSALMASTIRDGIVSQRRQVILTEATRSIANTQVLLNSSAAANSTQVQQLLTDTVGTLQSSAADGRQVFLWRTPAATAAGSTINDVSSSPDLGSVITPELRASVANDREEAHWQSVALPATGRAEPGVVVGSSVEVPLAGSFELYLVYSLEPEQRTLTFIQRVVWASLASLAAVLVLIMWLVARQMVRPIVTVSTAAKRIADGHLDERIPVDGSDEVAALEESFNAMAASLQEQIERLANLSNLQRRFVSDVSHELRTPLTTIRMAADILHDSRTDFPAPARRSVELLKEQIDRFELLLTDLLEISRFDAGAAKLDSEPRDIGATITTVISQMMPLARGMGVRVTLRVPVDRVVCEVDTVRFERIVRNLLANAIEHALSGSVEVAIGATPDSVSIRVRDHGIGLSPDDLPRVFDRFWRADPARARTTGGTGLGLSISLEDTLLHGGTLEVDGEPGRGATFLLTLPRSAHSRNVRRALILTHDRDEADARGYLPGTALTVFDGAAAGDAAAPAALVTDDDDQEEQA